MNATKRYFTGHIGVKIACFVLALCSVLMILNTFYDIALVYEKRGIFPEVIFSNQSPEQIFFDEKILNP